MKLIELSSISQSFSFLEKEKPSNVWAFSLNAHGIPHHVLETLQFVSQSWTGWGFNNGKPLLLFETREDAVFAKLRFGEIRNVN